MADLRHSQIQHQMLALQRIQKRRRLRYWLNAVHVSLLFFLADQILKIWVLRQLAPGDQVEFFGQAYVVLAHISTGTDSFLLNTFEWILWLTVVVALFLRFAEAESVEITSAMTILMAGISNGITRWVVGGGLNVFAVQAAPGSSWLSFNLAHLAIAVAAFFLTASWLKALWPESLAADRSFRV